MTYSEKLRDPRWQKKRLEILNRHQFSCAECGSAEDTLHVHHRYYTKDKEPWDYPDHALVALCEYCHDVNHSYKTKMQEMLSLHRSGVEELICYALDSLRKADVSIYPWLECASRPDLLREAWNPATKNKDAE